VVSGSEGIIEDTESVKENPEEFVENEYEAEESESFDSDPGTMNPSPEDFGQPSEDDSSEDDEDDSGEGFHQTSGTVPISHQGLPEWGDSEVAESLENLLKSEREAEEDIGSNLPSGSSEQGQGMTAPEITMRTTVPKSGNFASAIDLLVKSHGKIAARVASSSLPVDTMSGPRVDHIGPGMTENGWYNDTDALPSDDESLSGFVQVDPILDGSDGITGYDNPTDGDSSILVVSTDHYSWLPGSRNEKTFNYYDRGLSDSDIQWMRDNSDPDDPINPGADKRPDNSWLWEKLLWPQLFPPRVPPIRPSRRSVSVRTTRLNPNSTTVRTRTRGPIRRRSRMLEVRSTRWVRIGFLDILRLFLLPSSLVTSIGRHRVGFVRETSS